MPTVQHPRRNALRHIVASPKGRFQRQDGYGGAGVPQREADLGARRRDSIIPTFDGRELSSTQSQEVQEHRRGQGSNVWEGPPGIAEGRDRTSRGVDAHVEPIANFQCANPYNAQIGGAGGMVASMHSLQADSNVYACLSGTQPAQPRGVAGPIPRTGYSQQQGAGSKQWYNVSRNPWRICASSALWPGCACIAAKLDAR